MNPDWVFAKTYEGGEAVDQRTRLVQRNLRTVLILVDGKSTVGELVAKAGSADVLYVALEQLERDGFIRLVSGDRADGAAAPEGEPADTLTSAFVPPPVSVEAPPMEADSVPPVDVMVNPFAPPPVSRSPKALGPMSTLDAVSIPPAMPAKGDEGARVTRPAIPDPFQAAGDPFQTAPAGPFDVAGTAPARDDTPRRDKEPARQVKAPVEVNEAPPNVLAQPEKRFAAVSLPRLLTRKRLLWSPVVVLVVLLAGFFLYPFASHRAQIEVALSAVTGQTVAVDDVHASLWPFPALVLSGVKVGGEENGGAVTIGEIRAAPSLGYLFGGRRAFSRVVLAGTQVPMTQLGMVASGLGSTGAGRPFSLGRVVLHGFTIGMSDISFPDYHGRVDFAPDGGVAQMELQNREGTMGIQVGPGATPAEPTVVVLQGQGWKSGEASPFLFDSIAMTGRLSGSRLIAEKVEGRIFGGVIQGNLELDWSKGIRVGGDVNFDYLNAPQLAAALGAGSVSLEGQTSARIRFSAAGESWSAISGKVPLEGSFISKTGVIKGLDLVEAVRRGSKLATRGGATRFDELAGRYRWNGTELLFTDLELSSGPVRASGAVSVGKGGALTGNLAVVLQSSAATLRQPVSLTGTLKDPQLFGGRY